MGLGKWASVPPPPRRAIFFTPSLAVLLCRTHVAYSAAHATSTFCTSAAAFCSSGTCLINFGASAKVIESKLLRLMKEHFEWDRVVNDKVPSGLGRAHRIPRVYRRSRRPACTQGC